MRFLTSLLLILISSNFYSQSHEIGAGLQNLTNDSAYTSGTWIRNFEDPTIKGSVYLYENWFTQGIITTKEDKNISIKGLNYETKNDSFVAKISTDSIYIFNDSNIKEVRINNDRFKKYFNQETNSLSFFQVLAVGKDIEILKLNSKKIKNGAINPLTQVKEHDKYINEFKYYLKRGQDIKEIKLKKNAFCRLFTEDSKSINSFISENNLSLKDERNLQVILNHYNTL